MIIPTFTATVWYMLKHSVQNNIKPYRHKLHHLSCCLLLTENNQTTYDIRLRLDYMNIIKHRRLFPLDKDVLSELFPLGIISDTDFRINGAAQFIVCYQGTNIMHRSATFLWCIYQVHNPHYPIYHSSY